MSYITPQADANNPDAITNWRKAGNMQIFDGGATGLPGFFNVTTSITTATWESVGPTGSGADNIYTALNVLPSEARAVLVELSQTVITNAAGLKVIRCYGADGDEGSPSSSGATLIDREVDFQNASDQDSDTTQVWIPCNADHVFQMYWLATASLTFTGITMRLVGCMCDT